MSDHLTPVRMATIKKDKKGNSLTIQWLRHGTFTAMAWVQSLVRKLRSPKPCGAVKKRQEISVGEKGTLVHC